ncbi:hypothetical protein PHMEG_00033739 [Phytophthora megakarya]|uniref:Uncharacterized protein n=1 Tax=Phytophthora megakarya TaxID=4795 RepID=A0A225UV55_9STRA|nr:hypothetical protein PHMEG_00033739 [Phytophthora megakarya]
MGLILQEKVPRLMQVVAQRLVRQLPLSVCVQDEPFLMSKIDMIVDRLVAGLPFDSPKFATLSSFFAPLTSQPVGRSELERNLNVSMAAVFPGLENGMSIWPPIDVVSYRFLREELPSSHLRFNTPLFWSGTDLDFEWLRRRVVCRNYQQNDLIGQSGIPPHIGIMVTLEMYTTEVERMKKGLAEKFESALKWHINGSVMTMEAMEIAFETAFQPLLW